MTTPSLPDDADQAAVVTEQDRRIAPRFWGKYGTALLRALLRAVKREA